MGQYRPAGVHHRAGPDPDALAEEGPGVAGGNEADVVAVGLVGDRQPPAGGLVADRRLGGVAHRERRMRQLGGSQDSQHVGLVLVAVDRAAQPALRQPGIVAGCHRVEPQRQRPRGQRGELDPLVAAHAGVRGLAAGVGGHEVVDHVGFESVGEIPDVEGDSEDIGDAAGVTGVLTRAAAARPGAQRARCVRQRQVHAHHFVTGVDHAGRGDRGVHPAAHRGQHLHRGPPRVELASAAWRARSTAGGSTRSAASTSSSVLV